MSREITKSMLDDLEWINRQLKTMGSGYNKNITSEFIGRSIEYIKGALDERERAKSQDRLLGSVREDKPKTI
jgi:hypothetical protein